MNNIQLKPVFISENVIKSVRKFFEKRNFHEIIVPVLNSTIPAEPNIFPFVSSWDSIKHKTDYYLSTSPERALKIMIAEGVGSCFSIGKSFRNLENVSNIRIPEFLMLEFYRINADYRWIMDDVQKLILFIKKETDKFLGRKPDDNLMYQGKITNLESKWKVYSMIELFFRFANLHLKEIIDEENMRHAAENKGYKIEDATWEQLFNQIFLNEIEPNLGDNPCFVIDYPSRISPLAKVKTEDPDFSERFEFYLFNIELGNGNTENTNVEEIEKIFTAEKKLRNRTGREVSPLDIEFLIAIKKMKEKLYAGAGIGIDRLSMIMADVKNIKDVEPFADKFY